MLSHPLIMTRKIFETPFARSHVVLINRSRDFRWHGVYSDSTGNFCFLLSAYVLCLCLGWSWLFMRVSVFGMGLKSKPMLTNFQSARFFEGMQFSNSTKVLGKFQNWLSKPRRKMPLFLCQRWWQGPCWVLGNVSASNDFHWPRHPLPAGVQGCSFWELPDVEHPLLVAPQLASRALVLTPSRRSGECPGIILLAEQSLLSVQTALL